MHPAAVRERGPVADFARDSRVDLETPRLATSGLCALLTALVGVSCGAVRVRFRCRFRVRFRFRCRCRFRVRVRLRHRLGARISPVVRGPFGSAHRELFSLVCGMEEQTGPGGTGAGEGAGDGVGFGVSMSRISPGSAVAPGKVVRLKPYKVFSSLANTSAALARLSTAKTMRLVFVTWTGAWSNTLTFLGQGTSASPASAHEGEMATSKPIITPICARVIVDNALQWSDYGSSKSL